MLMLMMIMGMVMMMMMMMTWEEEGKIERRYVAPMEGRRLFCDNSTMIESSDSDDKIRMIITIISMMTVVYPLEVSSVKGFFENVHLRGSGW